MEPPEAVGALDSAELVVERRLESETPFSSHGHAIAEEIDVPALAAVPIHVEVWRIAWPSVLTFALMTTNAILDRIFVGRLGRDALAAVGVGGQILFLLVSLSMAVSVGTTALVARFTGAREPEQTVRAAAQSLSLSVIMGALCMVLVYAVLGPFLHMMGLTPPAQAACRSFLGTGMLCAVPMFMGNAMAAAVRGLGDTRMPLRVVICANIVHICLDWLLIFGHLGFPKMGLAGAGIALTSSTVVVVIVFVALISRGPLAAALQVAEWRLTLEWTRRILKIGIPAAGTALLRVGSLMSFTGVLARTVEGMSGVAALPIGLTAESIAFMPGFGYSVAAAALVGQSLGARDPDRAERFGWAATAQAVGIMTAMGAIFFTFATPFARLFTHDPAIVSLAASYLRIMALSEPMLGVGLVLTGALQGAGDTLRPAVITILSMWIFRLPVTWTLAITWGFNTVGAWTAMCISTILSGVLSVVIFREDSWKRIRV